MKKSKLFGLALVATMASFSACSNDAEEVLAQESEIKLTSEIASSRVTSLDYQSTQIVENQQVGVTITGAKSEHSNVAWTVSTDGAMTTENPIYYSGSNTATITAYHPYNESWDANEAYNFSVNTDQSVEANYLNSDLLWTTQTATRADGTVALTFVHKLAKINVTLTSDNIDDLSDATISICGTKIATTINPITGKLSEATGDAQIIKAGVTTADAITASAIVIPQTVESGTRFIKVEHGGKTYYYTLEADKVLKPTYSHNYVLTINEQNIALVAKSNKILSWNSEETVEETIEENVENAIAKISNNEIWYTTSDGNIISHFNGGTFGANIVSNDYENGKGVIKFDGNVTTIGTSVFVGWATLTSVTIPNSVTSIGDCAFSYCESLSNITIPNSVTAIGNTAFYKTSLQSVNIPKSVTKIEHETFSNCYSLTNITIPNGITSIGDYAFEECTSLITINVEATNPPSLGSDVFKNVAENCKIYVPTGSLDAYRSAWSTYASKIYAKQ